MDAARRIPTIGLTGAIAAGKSEALAAFARLGAATMSSDRIVHELLSTEKVRDVLIDRWGERVAPGGEIDRAAVGAIAFADPQELAWLESLLHPLVGERTAKWRRELPPRTRVAVLEVPLLFEKDMESLFDATVCVIADAETRVERAGARGVAELEARSAHQLTQEQKAARASYVVSNDGTVEELESELAAILPGIEAAAKRDRA